MAPHEFVEIRLVCKADYLDPKLKIKLHEIKDKLRQILHTGRRRFALKKVQPWNSVKVTFDIPKEAADRLHLLAIQGNVRLIELGILSVEIVGQSNAIVVHSNNNNNNATTTTNPTTNSKDVSVPSSSSSSAAAAAATTTIKTPIDSTESTTPSSSTHNFAYETKTDDHRHKRVKLENDTDQQTYPNLNNNFPHKSSTTVNLMQPPSTIGHPVGHYITQQNPQILHRQATSTNNYGRISYPNSISPTHPTYINSGKPPPPPSPNSYPPPSTLDNNSTLSNGIGNDMHNYPHHESWSTYVDHSNTYKMKVNGIRSNHYYPQQQQLVLSDAPSSSSSSSSNIYCTQQPTQYDMRRCETNLPQMTTSTTNIQNSYDGSSI
jgi:hypothetical protein